MLSGWLIALSLAASPGQCTTCGPGGGMEFSPGASGGSWSAGATMYPSYDSVATGGGGGGDQLYPFDSPEPWLHGHFQEIPAYGGYSSFRPYNYKHVLAQTQLAGSWGMSPSLAYSHQWYHRYRQRSGMHPGFGSPQASTQGSDYSNYAEYTPPQSPEAPEQSAAYAQSNYGRNGYGPSAPALTPLQQAAAFQQGYVGASIPGITTPVYQLPRIPREPEVQPIAPEYLEKLDQMQKLIEEQNFQMQVMQQQMQAQAPKQPWEQPSYTRLPEYRAGRQEQAAESRYEELPPPADSNSRNVTQPNYIDPQGAQPLSQPGPAYQFTQPAVPTYSQPPIQQPQQGYDLPAPQQQYVPGQGGPILQMPGTPLGASPYGAQNWQTQPGQYQPSNGWANGGMTGGHPYGQATAQAAYANSGAWPAGSFAAQQAMGVMQANGQNMGQAMPGAYQADAGGRYYNPAPQTSGYGSGAMYGVNPAAGLPPQPQYPAQTWQPQQGAGYQPPQVNAMPPQSYGYGYGPAQYGYQQ